MTSTGHVANQNSGRRELSNEATVLSNLSRMLHGAKVAHKEKRLVRKVEKMSRKQTQEMSTTHEGQRKEVKKEGVDALIAKKAKKQKRSSNKRGGSVWIMMKGGFAASKVPINKVGDSEGKLFSPAVEQRAIKRLEVELIQREKRLQDAEAYVDSAWREAEKGGLLQSISAGEAKGSIARGVPTEEGELYLMEQYKVASQLLSHPPVGQFVMDLTLKHGFTGLPATDYRSSISSECLRLLEKHLQKNKNRWVKLLQGEKLISLGHVSEKENAVKISVAEKEVMDELLRCWKPIAEDCCKQDEVDNDIQPTKCIIRVRNSQQQKHSSILSRKEEINSFKNNVLKVIKKGLSNSLLNKNGSAMIDEAENSGKKNSSNKAKHRQNQQQKESAKRGGKRRK